MQTRVHTPNNPICRNASLYELTKIKTKQIYITLMTDAITKFICSLTKTHTQFAFYPLSCWIDFRKHRNLFTFFHEFSTLRMHRWSKSLLFEDKNWFIRHGYCHGCYYPADVKGQGISNHAIDQVISEYSGFSIRKDEMLGNYRPDSRFAPSQWETALLCNDVSHWLGASLERALELPKQIGY